MAIHVEFDGKVIEWANGANGIDVDGATIQEALYKVSKAYPSFRMFNCDGELRSILKVKRGTEQADLKAVALEGETLTLSVG